MDFYILHPTYGAHEERMVNPLTFLQRFLVNLRGKLKIFPSLARLQLFALCECLQQDGILYYI